MLVTRGVTAAEPYLTRYVPALVLASVLPCSTVVAIATQDLLSACHRARHASARPGLRRAGRAGDPGRAETQWRAMASSPATSSTSCAACRPWSRSGAPRPSRPPSGEITDRYRRASLAHPAARVRLLGGSRAGRDPLGGARGGHGRGAPRGRRTSTCAPRSSSCCWPPRPTGRCAGWAPSSMPPPRGWRRSSGRAELLATDPRAGIGRAPERARSSCARCRQLPRARRSRPGRVGADPRPRVTAVAGPSGWGKSTLLGARWPACCRDVRWGQRRWPCGGGEAWQRQVA